MQHRDNVQIGFTESANAGSDQAICGSLAATLAGNAPSHGSGQWTVVSQPVGSNVTFGTPTSPTSAVTVDIYGLYEFRWTLTNPTGATCNTTDNVQIGFTESANAGSDQAICGSLAATLAGNAPSHGSGQWTVVSQPVGSNVTFGTPTSPTSTVTVDIYGLYEFRWTLTNPTGATCNTTDNVQIGFTESANAGSDQAICGALAATLAGNAPSHGSGQWTVVSQPVGSNVTFGTPTSPTSGVTVDIYGLYEFRWTLTNPTGATCNTTDNVQIGFTESANAGSDQAICGSLLRHLPGMPRATGADNGRLSVSR